MANDPQELPPESKPTLPTVVPPVLPNSQTQTSTDHLFEAGPRGAKAPRVVQRPTVRAPKLPILIALLCLRPETWAESARYRMSKMIRAVSWIVLLSGLALGNIAAWSGMRWAEEFAGTYDEHYGAMVYSSGTLSAVDPNKPLPQIYLPIYNAKPSQGLPFRVELGKHAGADETIGYHLTSRALVLQLGFSESRVPLVKLLGTEAGNGTVPAVRIDGTYLKNMIAENYWALFAYISILATLMWILSALAWTATVAFLIIPFIQIAAHGLGMSRRVAFKMALGICVPLVLLDAILRMCGLSLTESVGMDIANLVWAGLAALMGIWAGILANALYRAKKPMQRSRGM
jgi:hypothetical protein